MVRKKADDNYFKGRSLREMVTKSSYFIDTGNFAINYICSGKFIGGGIPGGKITEIFGPPSSAKSLVGYTVLGSCQKAGGLSILLDCERAANPDFVESAGHCNTEELGYETPISIEEVCNKIINMTKDIRKQYPDKPITFLWDSIGVTPTEREWKETSLPEKFTKAQFKEIVGSLERPGERARAAGDALRKLNPFLSENNTTLFIINQTRTAIGAMSWEPDEVTAGGGKALPFYAGLRLRMYASKVIEHKDLGVPVGVNLMCTNKKNRFHTPFLKTKGIQLYFDKGVNPLGGLLSALVGAGRIEARGSGNYQVLEPWATGQEVKFKGSLERNDIPIDVLLKCPAIVDATSAQEVKDYLGVFAEAINLATGDETEEKDVKDPNEEINPLDEE